MSQGFGLESELVGDSANMHNARTRLPAPPRSGSAQTTSSNIAQDSRLQVPRHQQSASPLSHNVRYQQAAHQEFGLSTEVYNEPATRPMYDAPGHSAVRSSPQSPRTGAGQDYFDSPVQSTLHRDDSGNSMAVPHRLKDQGAATTRQGSSSPAAPSFGLGSELRSNSSSPIAQTHNDQVFQAGHGSPNAAGKTTMYAEQEQSIGRKVHTAPTVSQSGANGSQYAQPIPSPSMKPGISASQPSFGLASELQSSGSGRLGTAASPVNRQGQSMLPASTAQYGLQAEIKSPAYSDTRPDRFGAAQQPASLPGPAATSVRSAGYGLEAEVSRASSTASPPKGFALGAELAKSPSTPSNQLAPQPFSFALATSPSSASNLRINSTPPRPPSAARRPKSPVTILAKSGKTISVVNRGALRAGRSAKGASQSAAVNNWLNFARRQAERYTPIPPNIHRRMLGKSKGYRLRIQQVVDLPLKQVQDHTFEFQLGVTLYDETLGAFYGNTCYSMHNLSQNKGASDQGIVDLNFSFDVYFHSSVSDPRCVAVAEVIVLERNQHGVIKGEYSLGWALLKLYQLEDMERSAAAAAPGMPDDTTTNLMAAPLVAGTPRYLLYRSIYGEDLAPPKVVERCHLLFQAEAYPAMDGYMHLLPENYLVTYSDILPGLRRFDQNGQYTASPKSIISMLASPMLAPMYRLGLTELKMGIPESLHKALASVTLTANRVQDKLPGYQVDPEPRSYVLRLGLHNGRCFVGPQQLVHGFQQQTAKGWEVLRLRGPVPCLNNVHGDTMAVLVAELLLMPQQDTKGSGRGVLLGWAAAAPFSKIDPDGSQAHIAEAPVSLEFSLREAPFAASNHWLHWQQLLPAEQRVNCPNPAIEFHLKDADKHGIVQEMQMLDSKQAVDQHSRPGSPVKGLQSPKIQDGSPFYGSPIRTHSPRLEEIDVTRSASMYLPVPDGRGGLASLTAPVGAQQLMMQPGQLANLAQTMQRQLDLLAKTVDDLREERQSLRKSLSAMPPPVDYQQPPQHQPSGVKTLTGDDIVRLQSISPTPSRFDHQKFAGATAPHSPKPKGQPTRAVMTQLHEAGAYDALPPEVQDVLRRRPAPRPSTAPVHMDIEAKDPRMVSDMIIQLMAYRHQVGANSSHSVSSTYFTFQFYHFPPTVSEPCYLTPCSQEDPDLHLLSPASQAARGPGIVFKYVVDGTLQPLSSGQSAAQAAQDQHLHFCQFLAQKSLSIDIWDSTSQLQVGAAVVDLRELLRQGREFSEAVLEVPVLSRSPVTSSGQAAPSHTSPWDDLSQDRPSAEPRGVLLLRLINIGREPTDLLNKQAAFDSVQTSQHAKKLKVKVRAAPYTPSSPLARALSGRPSSFASALGASPSGIPGTPFSPYAPGSPFSPFSPGLTTRQTTLGSMASGLSQIDDVFLPSVPDVTPSHIPFEDIYNFETRKLSRQRQLQQIRTQNLDKQDNRPPSPEPGINHRLSLQKQLLTDVEAERRRQKRSTVRQQLLRGLLVRQLLRPMYGEAMVYEQELCNPFNREVVLELRISHAEQLAPIRKLLEYKALVASGIRVHGHASHSSTMGGDEELVTKDNRIFLKANEKVIIPFKLQSFEAPAAYHLNALASTQPGSPGAEHSKDNGGQQQLQGHIIGVEVFVVDTQMPVMLLEVCVAPRPLVLDRTFRLQHPEKELLKHSISLAGLPSLAPALADERASGSLAVACSDKDVVVSVTTSGGRPEISLRCKGVSAPDVRQMFLLLYGDRALTRPVEVWQVFIHSLKKVDMAAIIGQTSTTAVVIRGQEASRRVACYSSHPDELQVTPAAFVLVAGALTELQLAFCPIATGRVDVRVNIVDCDTHEVVSAIMVCADAQIPLVTRSFEVEMPVGTMANKRINYTNPYQQHRAFTLRSNQPWLVTFTPPKLDLPSSATRPIGVILDGRNARPGLVDVLVFVNDEDDKSEECFKIRVRIQ